jgi:guanylate kinase
MKLSSKMSKSIIFSAPSGSGKTTIVRHVLNKFPNIQFSISATSRPVRGDEVDGRDYHFFTVDKFKSMIECGEFLEYQEVYPNQFYGTLESDVQLIWDMGGIVIFDVDVVGGINLKKILGDNALSFFVKAPSIEILEQRLRDRKTESEDKIQMRINKAHDEMNYQDHFDEVVINDNLELATNYVYSIIDDFIKN